MHSYTHNQPFLEFALTTSSYTPAASGEVTDQAAVGAPTTAQGTTGAWAGLRGAAAGLGRRPWLVQVLLDLAAAGFILLAFTTTTLSAEFLFHCVFVVLVFHAFLFGLRGTLVRILAVSIPLLVYAEAKLFGLHEPPLELTEWPLMFVIAALVAWMADRRSSTARRYATLFRHASERLLTVEEDERRRIAGELHDGVGQVLTALTLTLDAADADRTATHMRRRVRTARKLADTALAGTRDLSHRIRPTRLEERGLVAAVRDLARQSGFTVRVEAPGDLSGARRLGPTAVVEVYRITQEALANAAHHSGADAALVRLAVSDDRLTVVVEDRGRGFDRGQLPDSGIGLAGMVERARLIGGWIAIRSGPGSGTSVTLTVPLPTGTVTA